MRFLPAICAGKERFISFKALKSPIGRKWKLADLVKLFPTQSATMFLHGKFRTFRYVTRDVWIRDVAQKVSVGPG